MSASRLKISRNLSTLLSTLWGYTVPMGMVYPRFFRRLTTMANQNHLMHPRAANNYADNGYFPTDSATLARSEERL